ncbi:MAG: ABC transporter permease [Anaerolineaceae bacterium]|nr:ABC transporter permease [Anaerolineaceae bacterium]
MNKLWLVAFYEYKHHVMTKGFILLILSMPLIIAFIIVLTTIMEGFEVNDNPLGYVDQVGLLIEPVRVPQRAGDDGSEHVPLIAFDSEENAREALEKGEIQAYYVLGPDYLETRHAELFYNKAPGENAMSQFWDFVQINWLGDLQPEIADRAVAGSTLVARTPDGRIESSEKTILNAVFPGIIAFVFYFLIMVTTQTMIETVVKEKEDRMMEILVTSISPQRLVTAKILGVTAMCFTLLLGWIILAALAINVGGNVYGIEVLRNFQVDLQVMLKLTLVFVPAFVIVIAIVVALGASLVEVQEGQQIASLVALLFFSPYILIVVFIENPNSVLAIAMSFFPITAPFTFALRSMATFIPWWQIASSSVILILTAVFSIWLARKIFYLGLLSYGKRLAWKDIRTRLSLRNKARAQ